MKKIVMIIMAVALIALPTMAQDWQSTSTLQGSGSTYSSQVTEVGATGVSDMATTTESNSPARAQGGPRRSNSYGDLFDLGGDTDPSNEFPIGDAVLPMLLMAIAFGGYIAIKRRKLSSKKYIGNTI